MVKDKVGFAISKIETLAFLTTFDSEKRCGLNPVAAAEEAGIETNNLAMSTVMEYQALMEFRDAVVEYRDLLRFREVSK